MALNEQQGNNSCGASQDDEIDESEQENCESKSDLVSCIYFASESRDNCDLFNTKQDSNKIVGQKRKNKAGEAEKHVGKRPKVVPNARVRAVPL